MLGRFQYHSAIADPQEFTWLFKQMPFQLQENPQDSTKVKEHAFLCRSFEVFTVTRRECGPCSVGLACDTGDAVSKGVAGTAGNVQSGTTGSRRRGAW